MKRNPKTDKAMHFTKETLLPLVCPDGVDRLVRYDDEARGLGVRVLPSGKRTFFWYGREVGGRPVRKTIGQFPAMAIPEARRRANGYNADRPAPDPEPTEGEALTIKQAFEATVAASKRGERAKSDWDHATARFTKWLSRAYPKVNLWADLNRIIVERYLARFDKLSDTARRLYLQPLTQTCRRMNVLYGAPLFALDLRIGNRLKNPPARVFVKDVLSFLDWLRDHAPRLEGPAALQSLAGLRLTEAARVTWNHIDVKHGLVEVSGETKNEFSKRVIPICKRAVEALRRAWALRPVVKVQEMDGGHLATTDTGFHFEGGSFDNYGKILGTAIRSWNADIGWTAKDLRKALPTLAATEGWLSPVVEMYLGHAAKGVTATNYVPRLTSVSPGEKDALERSMAILRDLVVKPLEVAIEKASKPAMVVDAANPTA